MILTEDLTMDKNKKDVLSWIVKKNEENIDYLKGTIEQASKYIKELQESDGDNEYRAVGYCHEFNEQIKYKDLEIECR